jgi:predicted ribosome quality control (RQC) complex YloA/Tae2 family protein
MPLNAIMAKQPLTSFDIYFMAAELNNTLAGKTINRITAISNDIGFEIDGRVLHLVIHQGTPYIIEDDKTNRGRPWLTILSGGYINKIAQAGQDRLLVFSIAVFDRLGKRKNYNLYIELFKTGNIILTGDNNKIISSYRRIGTIGQEYSITRPTGLNILELTENSELSPSDIEEINKLNIFRHRADIPQSSRGLLDLIESTRANPQPYLLLDESGKIAGYSVYGPPFVNTLTGRPAKSLLEAVTAYVKNAMAVKPKRRIDYTKQIKRAEKKYEAMAAELEATIDFKNYRLYGELILAHLHELKKGQTECQLANLYDDTDEKIKIELNPTLSPRENADYYFDKARKLETSVPIIKKRLKQQQAEVDKLKSLQKAPEDLSEINRAVSTKKVSTQKRVPFRRFELGGGWLAYAGKSAKNNDELTFGFAHKDDFWFHAWQAQGSHLILRAPKKGAIADKGILIKAASLAAYYSKAKTSSKVPIIYTEVRYLKKVKKIPGKVIYTNVKELMVAPQSPQELLNRSE